MIRPLQLGKIHVLALNIFHRRIRRFAKRQGVSGIGNHTARDGYDNTSETALDGNRMIWTWKLTGVAEIIAPDDLKANTPGLPTGIASNVAPPLRAVCARS